VSQPQVAQPVAEEVQPVVEEAQPVVEEAQPVQAVPVPETTASFPAVGTQGEVVAFEPEFDVDEEEEPIELTEAPDLPSYESVLTENAELKEELSLKDRLIDSLREEIDVWKDRVEDLKESVNEWREKVEDWKDRFHGFAEEAGQKIMGYFGYETEDPSISEYPSKEFAEAYDSMKEDVSGIDPKSLRTIPDNEEEGKFRVVQRTDDGYETLRGGFDTRFEAESWQKDLASGVRSLDDNLEEGRSLHR
jgi:hypothetical protein